LRLPKEGDGEAEELGKEGDMGDMGALEIPAGRATGNVRCVAERIMADAALGRRATASKGGVTGNVT